MADGEHVVAGDISRRHYITDTGHSRHHCTDTADIPQHSRFSTDRDSWTLPKQIGRRLAAGLWQFLRVPLARRTGRGTGNQCGAGRGRKEDRSDRRLRRAPNYTLPSNTVQAVAEVPYCQRAAFVACRFHYKPKTAVTIW